jgi:hypothetical protein
MIILVWLYFAHRSFTGLQADFKNKFSAVASRLDLIAAPDGRAMPEIPYGAARTLAEKITLARPDLEKVIGAMDAGRGMSFWYPSSRKTEAEAMTARVQMADKIGQTCRLALEDLGREAGNIPALIGRGVQARKKAAGALRAEAEAGDLQTNRNSLEEMKRACEAGSGRLSELEAQSPQRDNAAQFRLGIIQGLKARLAEEAKSLEANIQACERAEQELDRFKAKLEGALNQDSGILQAVESISRSLAPAVDGANRLLNPVRNALNRLKQPVGQGGFSIDPLSVAKTFVPSVGPTISATEALLSALESAQTNINEVLRVTGPLNEAIDDFRSSGSRSSMLRVITASRAGASFYASKAGIFDPIIDKTAEAKGAVQQIADNRFLAGAAQTVVELIEAIEEPFDEGKQAIINLSRSLGTLDAVNKEYGEAVSRIASTLPGFTPGESWETEQPSEPSGGEGHEMISLTAPMEEGSAIEVMNRWTADRTCAKFDFGEGSGSNFSSIGTPRIGGTLSEGCRWISREAGDSSPASRSALRFDGTSGYARLERHPIEDGPFTFMLWARKIGPSQGNSPPLVRANAPGSGGGYCLYWYEPNLIQALICTEDSNQRLSYDNAPLDTWVHIAVTYDLSRIRLYIDGRLFQELEQHGRLKSPNWPLSIGGQGGGVDDSYFHGDVAGLRFCTQAIGPESVQSIFAGESSGGVGQDGAAPSDASRTSDPRVSTLESLNSIGTAVESFIVDMGQAPQAKGDIRLLLNAMILNDEGFVTKTISLVPFWLKNLPEKDGWGNALKYFTVKGDRKSYSVVSAGSDGVIGTEDDLYFKNGHIYEGIYKDEDAIIPRLIRSLIHSDSTGDMRPRQSYDKPQNGQK